MRLCLLVGLFVLVAAPEVRAQLPDVIAPTGQWVTDRAGLLTAAERRALSEDLAAYARETSTQIVVVTLPDIGGGDAGAYATELGQAWGVGRGDVDNGAVLLVVRDTRQVFIATGFGLEGAVPDALAGRIVRNVVVPAFRQGHFYAGLQQAVDAIQAAAAGEYEAIPAQPRGGEGVNLALIFIAILLAYFVISSIVRGGGGGGGPSGGRRTRRRSGPGVIFIPGGFGGGGGGFSGGGFGGGGFGGFGGGGGGFGGGGAGGSW